MRKDYNYNEIPLKGMFYDDEAPKTFHYAVRQYKINYKDKVIFSMWVTPNMDLNFILFLRRHEDYNVEKILEYAK